MWFWYFKRRHLLTLKWLADRTNERIKIIEWGLTENLWPKESVSQQRNPINVWIDHGRDYLNILIRYAEARSLVWCTASVRIFFFSLFFFTYFNQSGYLYKCLYIHVRSLYIHIRWLERMKMKKTFTLYLLLLNSL